MIYLVEDDNSIRDLVVYTLETSGLPSRGFACAAEFWEAMEKETPSLVLLDIMLPDEDGLSILKKLRRSSQAARLPVIMLTARGTEYDKVVGLNEGADDYIPKPFGMMELVARVRALLRRAESGQAEKTTVFRIGDIMLDPKKHVVKVKDETVTLTYKEFELLQLLMENEGNVLTREQIMGKIWGYDFDGETRTVDVHVRSLRMKLGTAGDRIETVRGVGYKIGN